MTSYSLNRPSESGVSEEVTCKTQLREKRPWCFGGGRVRSVGLGKDRSNGVCSADRSFCRWGFMDVITFMIFSKCMLVL